MRGERKTPNLQAAAGPFQPTRPTGAQVGPAAVGRGALAACRRAAPGEVGRCAAAWPARRVGRRGSRHPGMLQLQPGRGGGADCCAPGSQLGWEDLRWSGREGSRGPQSRGPAAPERRRRRGKLAPVNFCLFFFFFKLLLLYCVETCGNFCISRVLALMGWREHVVRVQLGVAGPRVP